MNPCGITRAERDSYLSYYDRYPVPLRPILVDPALAGADALEAWEESIIAETIRRARLYQKCTEDQHAATALLKLCSRDPLLWVDSFAHGYDPRRKQIKITPWVCWPYQRTLILATVAGIREAAHKSRDVGVSFCIILAFLYDFTCVVGSELGASSITGADVYDKTADSLLGKCEFILGKMPRFARPRTEFVASPRALLTNLDNGNTIAGRKTTVDAWHGPRRSKILVDEAARVKHLEKFLRGVDGATDAPILASTPDGPAGHWPRIVKGEGPELISFDALCREAGILIPQTLADYRELERVAAGRYVLFDVPYNADPRKDADWEERKRRTMTPEAWEEQYGRSFEASGKGRYWPEFSESLHVYSDDEWATILLSGRLEDADIYESWDTGLHTSVTWGAHLPEENLVIILGGLSWYSATAEQIARDIAGYKTPFTPWGWATKENPRGLLPAVRCGDPAMNQRLGSEQRSWAADLKELGIIVKAKGISGRVHELITRVRMALIHERLVFSPYCRVSKNDLPSLVQVVQSYRRKTNIAGDVIDTPEKDEASHPADTIQYMLDWVWPRDSFAQLIKTNEGWKELGK